MANVHLLMKKEEIDAEKLSDDKIAVVFDVLLATSTITSALYYGAKEVIPVLNKEEAMLERKKRPPEETLLVGELHGRPIDGFMLPHPAYLKDKVKNKTLILSTTNGTIAIRKAAAAGCVYVSSILNGDAVAADIAKNHGDESVMVICSGASGSFCIEDFYGAGYFIDCLVSHSEKDWRLTDAAQSALLFYRGTVTLGDAVLKSSAVGTMLMNYGLEDVIDYVTGRGKMPVVPILADAKRVIKADMI